MKIRKKQGIALISVLMVLTIMISLTLGFVWYTTQDYFISIAHQHSNACTYLAQGGIEYVLFLMKHNMMIFPSAPYNDNYKQNNAAVAYMQDEPYQATGNDFYAWVGRRELLGADGDTDTCQNASNWGKGTNTNNYDTNADGIIDATTVAGSYPLPMNHKCMPNDTTAYAAGSIVNAFNNTKDGVQSEYLLISELTLSTLNVGIQLGDTNACGTFKINVTGSSPDSSQKYYTISSTGMVKTVPASEMANDPATWQIQDESKFIPVSRRTILCKIPYLQTHFNGANGYWPAYENNLINSEYMIFPNSWYYKFR